MDYQRDLYSVSQKGTGWAQVPEDSDPSCGPRQLYDLWLSLSSYKVRQ